MEVLLDLIEDLLEKYNSGDTGVAEDAKNSLKSNKEQFIANLKGFDSPKAQELIEKLNSLEL